MGPNRRVKIWLHRRPGRAPEARSRAHGPLSGRRGRPPAYVTFSAMALAWVNSSR